MPLLIHLLIALTSVAYTTYLFIAPTKSKFVSSYALVVLTILSGSYLVALSPTHMAEACIAGVLYTGLMLAGIMLAKRKLAAQSV